MSAAAMAVNVSPAPIRVVSIDDHPDLRRLYRLAFRGTRLQIVAEAGDGKAGVVAVRKERPDLVLLDLSMPNMDGLETLIAIRQDWPDARVVILSGFTRDRVGDLVSRLGAVDYLEKGIRPGELVERLLDAVQRTAPEFVAPSEDQVRKMRERLRQLI